MKILLVTQILLYIVLSMLLCKNYRSPCNVIRNFK
uniref:Uncharacterized protein n=1 Tax=Amphimedon queenslandica TaxID=400682 RepID=A0A1X7TQI0_AMPQE